MYVIIICEIIYSIVFIEIHYIGIRHMKRQLHINFHIENGENKM